jgi:membrane-associated protease RseP (regulator of RpoE activity)
MELLSTLAIFALILVLHEAAHAVAAELLFGRGSVARFSLGLPPVLFRLFTFRGIDFTIGKLPLGASTGIRRSKYDAATRGARMVVAVSGIAVNLLCFALFPLTSFGQLSLALGLFNLLPIPGGFDGGHLIVEILRLDGDRRAKWEGRGRRITVVGCLTIVVLSLLVGVTA